MVNFFRIVLGEIRREFMRARRVLAGTAGRPAAFHDGILAPPGLFNLVAEGEYDSQARLASLIGYVVGAWPTAASYALLAALATMPAWARWQVWLSAVSPHLVLMARSLAILLYHSARGLLLIAVLVPLSGISIDLAG